MAKDVIDLVDNNLVKSIIKETIRNRNNGNPVYFGEIEEELQKYRIGSRLVSRLTEELVENDKTVKKVRNEGEVTYEVVALS